VLGGAGLLIIEMILYSIRMTETERYRGHRERNQTLGRQGKVIKPLGLAPPTVPRQKRMKSKLA
jgi:hypothetical protein